MSWNDLTERQKDLDRAIEQCGIKLDDSKACLANVMRAIGASAAESSYIKSRIELRFRTQAAHSKADDLIATTEVMLGQFEKMMRNGTEKGVHWELIFKATDYGTIYTRIHYNTWA